MLPDWNFTQSQVTLALLPSLLNAACGLWV